jgi:hypothetical protein
VVSFWLLAADPLVAASVAATPLAELQLRVRNWKLIARS